MLLSTTHSLEGYQIARYYGVVTGEAIMGANIVRDLFASITDVIGGRSGAYESKLQDARQTALNELQAAARNMGANAVIGIDINHAIIGKSMLMVSATGTAVFIQ